MRATSARFIGTNGSYHDRSRHPALTAAAQTPPAPAPNTQKPGMTPRPPLLFSEPWRLPPYTGEQTDENMRFTPAVVTNASRRGEAIRAGRVGHTRGRARGAHRPVERDGLVSGGGDAAGPAQLCRSDRRRPFALDCADQRDSSAAPGREAGGRPAHRRRSRHHDAWRVSHRRSCVQRNALVRDWIRSRSSC